MKPTPKYIKAIARAAGFDTARPEGSWQGYRVYSGRPLQGPEDPDEDGTPEVGQPLIILQEPGQRARIATEDEARAYLQAVAKREDELAEFKSLLPLLEFTTPDEGKRRRILQEINSGEKELIAYYPGWDESPEPDPEAEYLGGIIDGSLLLQRRRFNSITGPNNTPQDPTKEGK